MAHPKLAIIRRRLFTTFAALSAAACAACAALWVSSFWTAGVLIWDRPGWSFVVRAQRNLIGIRLFADDQGPDRGLSVQRYPNPDFKRTGGLWDELRLPGAGTLSKIGFGYSVIYTDQQLGWRLGNQPVHQIYVPHWFLALLFAILPALYLRATIRDRKRNRAGLCPVCGYDLRATPDRCPECGRVNDE